jgi:hypothetical protein
MTKGRQAVTFFEKKVTKKTFLLLGARAFARLSPISRAIAQRPSCRRRPASTTFFSAARKYYPQITQINAERILLICVNLRNLRIKTVFRAPQPIHA